MSDNQDEIATGLQALFDQGLSNRKAVLGSEYVDRSLSQANSFTQSFQHITTELCWGYIWGRPGLDFKTRSMVNIAMLTALGKSAELKLHIAGALRTGVTADEIKEILLQATIYCGIPAGLEAFKAANEVLSPD